MQIYTCWQATYVPASPVYKGIQLWTKPIFTCTVPAIIFGTRIAVVIVVNGVKVIAMRFDRYNLQETIVIVVTTWSLVLCIAYLFVKAII